MGIGSNVDKLMKIDSIIKKGLENEIEVMKEIYMELTTGLKQIKSILTQTRFGEITDENRDDVLKDAKEAIISFISSLAPLDELDERFLKIREHMNLLKGKLETLKNTLAVYGAAEKAIIDFDNNILYGFKVTVLRDFEQDMEFNKKMEEAFK